MAVGTDVCSVSQVQLLKPLKVYLRSQAAPGLCSQTRRPLSFGLGIVCVCVCVCFVVTV